MQVVILQFVLNQTEICEINGGNHVYYSFCMHWIYSLGCVSKCFLLLMINKFQVKAFNMDLGSISFCDTNIVDSSWCS